MKKDFKYVATVVFPGTIKCYHYKTNSFIKKGTFCFVHVKSKGVRIVEVTRCRERSQVSNSCLNKAEKWIMAVVDTKEIERQVELQELVERKKAQIRGFITSHFDEETIWGFMVKYLYTPYGQRISPQLDTLGKLLKELDDIKQKNTLQM